MLIVSKFWVTFYFALISNCKNSGKSNIQNFDYSLNSDSSIVYIFLHLLYQSLCLSLSLYVKVCICVCVYI